MTLYAGIAQGGPFDGKPIYHGLQTVKVARNKLTGKVVSWFGPPTDEIRIDEYRYVIENRWIWKEK